MVEQLIRNQQVWGSNPHAGSREIKGLAEMANPIFILGYHKERLLVTYPTITPTIVETTIMRLALILDESKYAGASRELDFADRKQEFSAAFF